MHCLFLDLIIIFKFLNFSQETWRAFVSWKEWLIELNIFRSYLYNTILEFLCRFDYFRLNLLITYLFSYHSRWLSHLIALRLKCWNYGRFSCFKKVWFIPWIKFIYIWFLEKPFGCFVDGLLFWHNILKRTIFFWFLNDS